jgi:hypothetical protein
MWNLTVAVFVGVLAQAEAPPPPTPTPSAPPQARLPESVLRAGPAEASPPSAVRLTSFDPAQTDLRWTDNRWRLEAGGRLLKDFGRHEADAREAARLVRSLHLNQHGEIGTPRPVMEYWLSNGQAPTGPVPGFRALPIQQATLKVEQVRGQWCVRDASRVLFNFGGHEAEAREAHDVIRRHGFNSVGYVGRGGPTMLVFLAGHDTPAPAAMPRPETPAPAKVPPVKPPEIKPPSVGAAAIAPESMPFARQLSGPVGVAAGNPGSGVDRIPFEWRSLQVRREGKDWKLMSGGYTIADFGPNERDARMAHTMMQFYRCSEHCRIGQPTAVFDYFLSGGQAPRGSMLGVERVPFRPSELVVQQNSTGWVITDATRTLFRFGENEQAARQALKDIQTYRFDTICRVGRAAPHQLNVLVRAR